LVKAMVKLTEALEEAAALAAQDEEAFISGCSQVLTKIKRGISEVRKAPDPSALLDRDVPAEAGAWSFLLRVASEKPAFAKQVWDATAVLLESTTWVVALRTIEHKTRFNIVKAANRDAAMVAGLVGKLLSSGAVADLAEVLPVDAASEAEPTLCVALLDQFQADDYPSEVGKAACASEAGRAVSQRALAAADASIGERRKVIGGGTQKTFGKGDDIPVYVCEGIHGSHQKMDIKKGVV